jgi:TM2 domain-containing membrane protein YozV
MSQGQDWNAPDATPGYPQQQQPGQAYEPPPAGQDYYQQEQPGQAYPQQPAGQPYQQQQQPWQGYQQPQGPYGYAPAPYQQPYPQGYPAQVLPKNPGIALLISFFIPGVGSIYAGKTSTGVAILVGYIVSWVLTVVIIGFAGILGFWIWGMIDAYQAAQAWNRARGLES